MYDATSNLIPILYLDINCTKCGRKGHTANDCKTVRNDNYRENSNR